ncbi:MAG: hypothetical protein NTX38_17855 [Methylobacter sp.]|nr:hypothetical protein [Methylobacter sp.]
MAHWWRTFKKTPATLADFQAQKKPELTGNISNDALLFILYFQPSISTVHFRASSVMSALLFSVEKKSATGFIRHFVYIEK